MFFNFLIWFDIKDSRSCDVLIHEKSLHNLFVICIASHVCLTSICLDKIYDYVYHVFLQTKVLTAIFSLPHGDFLSSWCSSELPMKEEDGAIEYDSFAAAGWVLDVFPLINPRNPPILEFTAVSNSMPQASYAHQRTSLFVKVIANLHCFVPTICEG